MPRKASSSGGRASKIARTEEAEDVTQSAAAKMPPSPTHAAAGGKKGKKAEESSATAEAHPSHGHRGGSAAALEAKPSATSAIPPAPIKAIVYNLKHPKSDTMGEYRKEAAKRYNGERAHRMAPAVDAPPAVEQVTPNRQLPASA